MEVIWEKDNLPHRETIAMWDEPNYNWRVNPGRIPTEEEMMACPDIIDCCGWDTTPGYFYSGLRSPYDPTRLDLCRSSLGLCIGNVPDSRQSENSHVQVI